MIRLFNHFIPVTLLALFLIEAAILAISVSTGAAIRFHDLGAFDSHHLDLTLPTFAFIAVMLAVMASFGLYSADLPAGTMAMIVRLAASYVVGLCAVSIVFYLVPDLSLGRGVFAISWGLALVVTVLLRVAFLRYWSRLELFRQRVLVLGTGRNALELDRIERGPHSGNFRLVGFLPLGETDHQVESSRILEGEPSISAAVKSHEIDEVIIAIADRRGGKLPVHELLECKLAGVKVTEMSAFYERERGQLPIESITASWMVFSDGFRPIVPRQAFKAAFDFTASLALFIATLPLMVLTALCVWLEDGGPVLYRQQRVGRGGKPFEILKFRSMKVDAEKTGARWASAGDQRVTRVGRVIRKLRLDELPQVINVLRGEMSFVGPRPERPCFVSELVKQIPHYAVRHSVKPGITGWAQVRYPYSDSPGATAEKLQFDLYYVKNQTLFLDIMIVVETVGVVLWGKGAR